MSNPEGKGGPGKTASGKDRIEEDVDLLMKEVITGGESLRLKVARIETKLETVAKSSDVNNLETKLIKWFIGTVLGFSVLLVGLSGLLVAVLRWLAEK